MAKCTAETASAAGKKGGQTTVKRHGHSHMAAIGKKGFTATVTKHWRGDRALPGVLAGQWYVDTFGSTRQEAPLFSHTSGMIWVTKHERGELRQRYREGQEEYHGALGLVVNSIVLWNTLYLNHALTHVRASEYPVNGADVARISPLHYAYLNFLG